jgi:hypothetical protein
MSGPNPRPIGPIAFVVVILLSALGVGLSAGTARAANCLAAPNGPLPQGGHWYYRTDRATQRKCWSLRAAGSPPQQVATRAMSEAPAARPPGSTAAPDQRSFASFKEFMAHHGGANLSEKDLEKLYAQFLQWNGKP